MCLKVWMPLVSDFNNQGLDPITVTNNGTTFGSGKLGKCAVFDGTNYISLGSMTLGTAFSICMWVKINTWKKWYAPLNFYNQTTQDMFTVFGLNSDSDARATVYIRKGINAISDDYGFTNLAVDTWYHICVTYGNNTLTYYQNGKVVYTKTIALSETEYDTCCIGRRNDNGYLFNGCVNDVRIYDECISPKMVKEISKGLLCHYKLSGINKNLLSGSDFIIEATNETAGSTTGINMRYAGNLEDLKGKTLTFSYYLSAEGERLANSSTSLGNRFGIHGQANVTYDSGNTATLYPFANYLEAGGTRRCIMTHTFPSNATISYFGFSIQIYAKPAEGNDETWYIKYPKLEFGDTATAWVPNEADELYSALGYDDNTEYDCSGYGYHGRSGHVLYDSNSIRYSGCYKFPLNESIVGIAPCLSNGQTITEISVSCWFKTSTLNSTVPNIFSLGGNSFLRCRLDTYKSTWSYYKVGQTMVSLSCDCVKPLIDNAWHHFVFTFKNGISYVYVDGELINSKDSSSIATYLTCDSTDWYLAGYGNDENFIGDLSDFRIYATALSESDVKQLYNTPISLDKNSTLYSYEFEEV